MIRSLIDFWQYFVTLQSISDLRLSQNFGKAPTAGVFYFCHFRNLYGQSFAGVQFYNAADDILEAIHLSLSGFHNPITFNN